MWLQSHGVAAPPSAFPGSCVASLLVGDCVRVSGPGGSGLHPVAKVNIDSPSESPAVGIVISKPSATRCVVQTGGKTPSIYLGLTPGSLLYVGTDGRPTQAAPVLPPPGTTRCSQIIASALDADAVVVNPMIPIELIG